MLALLSTGTGLAFSVRWVSLLRGFPRPGVSRSPEMSPSFIPLLPRLGWPLFRLSRHHRKDLGGAGRYFERDHSRSFYYSILLQLSYVIVVNLFLVSKLNYI